MTIIVIKDLPESVELDRQAMLAIAGGSRSRARGALARPAFRGTPLLTYPSAQARAPRMTGPQSA